MPKNILVIIGGAAALTLLAATLFWRETTPTPETSKKQSHVETPADNHPTGDIELGAYVANTCTSCHSNVDAADAIPTIETLSPNQIRKALVDYRTGTRKNSAMQAIAKSLSTVELDALIAYFASKNVNVD